MGNCKRGGKGFTLLEMLMAMTVAAIIISVLLNIFETFHHGITETTVRYGRFLTEKATELRCRTHFVRGLAIGDFRCKEAFRDSSVKLHTYFRF